MKTGHPLFYWRRIKMPLLGSDMRCACGPLLNPCISRVSGAPLWTCTACSEVYWSLPVLKALNYNRESRTVGYEELVKLALAEVITYEARV